MTHTTPLIEQTKAYLYDLKNTFKYTSGLTYSEVESFKQGLETLAACGCIVIKILAEMRLEDLAKARKI